MPDGSPGTIRCDATDVLGVVELGLRSVLGAFCQSRRCAPRRQPQAHRLPGPEPLQWCRTGAAAASASISRASAHRHSPRLGALPGLAGSDQCGCSDSVALVQLRLLELEVFSADLLSSDPPPEASPGAWDLAAVTMGGRPTLYMEVESPRIPPGVSPALRLLPCRSVRYAAFVSGGWPRVPTAAIGWTVGTRGTLQLSQVPRSADPRPERRP